MNLIEAWRDRIFKVPVCPEGTGRPEWYLFVGIDGPGRFMARNLAAAYRPT